MSNEQKLRDLLSEIREIFDVRHPPTLRLGSIGTRLFDLCKEVDAALALPASAHGAKPSDALDLHELRHIIDRAHVYASDILPAALSDRNEAHKTACIVTDACEAAMERIDAALAAAQAAQAGAVPGATTADRLDAMADQQEPGSQAHCDLLAAATAWRKHLAGPSQAGAYALHELADQASEAIADIARIWPDVYAKAGKLSRLDEKVRAMLAAAPSQPAPADGAAEATLAEVRRVLKQANVSGLITGTIWRGPAETLFDFIDNTLSASCSAHDALYSLDADPSGIRTRAAHAITGALAFGAQDTNPPPAGHWLKPFWDMARAERDSAPAQPDAADAARYRWLRQNRSVLLLTGFFGNGCVNRCVDEVDDAIDAALAIHSEKGLP